MNAACTQDSPQPSTLNHEPLTLNPKPLTLMKLNWKLIIKIVKFLGTVLTTIAGTLAVQSCSLM